MFFIDPSSQDIGRSFSSAPYYFTPSVRSGIGIEEEDFMLSPNSNSENFSFHLLEENSPPYQRLLGITKENILRGTKYIC